MVEQQERRGFGVTLVVEHGVDGEPVADPVPFGLAVDAQDSFHATNMGSPWPGIKIVINNI
jgi:hypothetical protein